MNPGRCLPTLLATASLFAQAPPEALRQASERMKAEAFRTQGAYSDLAWLCDRIGHRLAGSPQLDQAIAWAQGRMKAAGLTKRSC